jgi:hypothetical protein
VSMTLTNEIHTYYSKQTAPRFDMVSGGGPQCVCTTTYCTTKDVDPPEMGGWQKN